MTEVVRTTITGGIGNLQADVVSVSSDPTKSGLVITNPDGTNIGGPLDGYVTANYDTSTSTYYFGKIKSDGSWIIEKLIGGASTFCKGASDYATNWTNRASLTYVLYSEL